MVLVRAFAEVCVVQTEETLGPHGIMMFVSFLCTYLGVSFYAHTSALNPPVPGHRPQATNMRENRLGFRVALSQNVAALGSPTP